MSCKVYGAREQHRNMTPSKPVLFASWVAASLALSLAEEHAQAACRAGHAVELTIALAPQEAATRRELEQRLAAELRARDLDVCGPEERVAELAHVQVVAPLPELSPTLVRVRTADSPALERNLNLAELPRKARPSAIASA